MKTTTTKVKTPREVRVMLKDLAYKRDELVLNRAQGKMTNQSFHDELMRLSTLIVALRWTLGLEDTLGEK